MLTSRPQSGPLRLSDDPLAIGLIQAETGLGLVDAGAPLVVRNITGTVTQRPDALELATVNAGLSRLVLPHEKTNSFTVAILVKLLGVSTGYSPLIGLMYDTAGSSPFGDQIDLNGTPSQLARFAFNTGGNAQAITSGTGISSTQYDWVFATFTSGSQVLYQNGVQSAAGAYVGTPSFTNTAVLGLGNMLADGRNPNCSIQCGFRWNRVLSKAEMDAVSANPWRLFEDPNDAMVVTAQAVVPATLTPDPAAITVAGNAPVIGQPISVSPGNAALAVSGLAPTIAQPVSVSPTPAALNMAGYVPALAQPQTVSPAPAALAVGGYAPAVTQPLGISPAPAAIAIAGNAPVVGQPVTVAPAAGALTVAAFAPTITQLVTISPAPAAISLAGYVPVLAQPQTVSPAAVNMAGYAPTLGQSLAINPGSAAIAISGPAPTIAQPRSVSPSPAALAVAGYAPLVAQPLGISPTAAGIALAGYVPAVTQPLGLSPAPAALTLAGYAPVLGQPRAVAPGTGAIVISGFAPLVTTSPLLRPDTAQLLIAGYAPDVAQPLTPIPLRAVSITQDDLLAAIRTFILTLVTQPILRTPIDRTAMPVGSFIAMSPGSVKALATNTHGPLINGTRSVKRSSQFDCQIDCYGIDAGNTALMLSMMFRDAYAYDYFPDGIAPLYAEDAHQMPIVTGEAQYLERWTFDIALQFNPVVSMPVQSANMLEFVLRNVDRTYPP